MIQDLGFAFNVTTPPPPTVSHISSTGYDLNPDFGNGPAARKSPLLGPGGEDVLLRIDVLTNFAAAAGAPICQFHAIISDTIGPALILGNFIHVGSNVGPNNALAAPPNPRNHPGYLAADLVAGDQLFIRFNPWTEAMGRRLAPTQGFDLRYLRLAMLNPNAEDGTTGFSAGAVQAAFVAASDISSTPQDFIYPAGRVMVG